MVRLDTYAIDEGCDLAAVLRRACPPVTINDQPFDIDR
jgi:hypothetical protein